MDRMTSENAGEDLYDHHWAFGNTKAVTGVCMSCQGSGRMDSKGHRSAISDLSLSAPCPSKLTSAVGPIIGCSCFSRPFDLDIAFRAVVSQQASIASYHTA
jgi:hypothetical protein